MPFTGDLSGLLALSTHLNDLKRVPSQAATEAAEELQDLIEAEFDNGNDPYGQPWAPLQPATLRKGRTPPPLTDTGDMRDSLEVKPSSGAGINITFGVDYASYHQYGTRKMAKRPMLPDEANMPPSWVDAVSAACQNATDRRMGGR